jgi:hypothetical protein
VIGQEVIEGRFGCDTSQCLPQGDDAGYGICNLNLDNVESIRKVVGNTFGPIPFVVSGKNFLIVTHSHLQRLTKMINAHN